jgi:hypothetical protein
MTTVAKGSQVLSGDDATWSTTNHETSDDVRAVQFEMFGLTANSRELSILVC